MEIDNEEFGLKFTVPDQPGVLHLLTYDSKRVELDEHPPFIVLWECALTIVDDWECELLPDPSLALDVKDDLEAVAQIARLIEFVGVTVSEWRRSLDVLPKVKSGTPLKPPS